VMVLCNELLIIAIIDIGIGFRNGILTGIVIGNMILIPILLLILKLFDCDQLI